MSEKNDVNKSNGVSVKGDVVSAQPLKIYTVRDVKNLFPTGKLENNFIIDDMKAIIERIPIEKRDPKKIINLSETITERDYEVMTKLLNLHDGKYIETFLTSSKTDDIPNMQKLALFARMLNFTHQKEVFLNLI